MSTDERIDALLSSSRAMDDFIHSLANYHVTNRNGSAYRQVRLVFYHEGVLLISQHHVNDYCSIAITDRPDIPVYRGCTDSCANGSASPHVKEGQLTTVWSSGKWIKRGPWEPAVRSAILVAMQRLEEAKEKKRVKEEVARAEREKAAREREQQLQSAWT